MPPLGSVAGRMRGEPVSAFRFTDDEVALRRQAYTIVQPARASQREDRLFAEFRHSRLAPLAAGEADIGSYFRALMGEPFASSEARFSALSYDIRTDEDRLTPFFSLARALYLADEERLAAAARVPGLSGGEAANVEARVAENRALIADVRAVMQHRARAYRYALDRLAIHTPSVRVRAVEATLASFEARLADPLGLAVAGGRGAYGYRPPAGAVVTK